MGVGEGQAVVNSPLMEDLPVVKMPAITQPIDTLALTTSSSGLVCPKLPKFNVAKPRRGNLSSALSVMVGQKFSGEIDEMHAITDRLKLEGAASHDPSKRLSLRSNATDAEKLFLADTGSRMRAYKMEEIATVRKKLEGDSIGIRITTSMQIGYIITLLVFLLN